MKLTRLRLLGFKSFVEPTDFAIEPGLTGIVGPNGCGKSNLVEALRWVMGESSHKSMRAASMDDVIFSGSNTRPARNNAEVAIAIDNSSRSAPAAFNDQDSIEIARRIERTRPTIASMGEVRRPRRRSCLPTLHRRAFARAQHQGRIGEIIQLSPSSVGACSKMPPVSPACMHAAMKRSCGSRLRKQICYGSRMSSDNSPRRLTA
jgi:chromosome segregation protein